MYTCTSTCSNKVNSVIPPFVSGLGFTVWVHCQPQPTWHGLDFTCNFPQTVLRPIETDQSQIYPKHTTFFWQSASSSQEQDGVKLRDWKPPTIWDWKPRLFPTTVSKMPGGNVILPIYFIYLVGRKKLKTKSGRLLFFSFRTQFLHVGGQVVHRTYREWPYSKGMTLPANSMQNVQIVWLEYCMEVSVMV